MKMWAFASRNGKEILRDPLNLAFGLGFPLALILLLSAIQTNVPVPLFEIEKLAPGVAVFGLSFMTLFSATVIARDRGSSLFQRLYTTPLTPADFILGYAIPMLPISVAQCAICYGAAILLGHPVTIHILPAIILIIPISVLYISLGLLCGSMLNDKQVGGVCGALLTNLSAWVSGIWFDLELVGETFREIAYKLPFVHAVQLQRAALAGNYGEIAGHILWVLGYGIGVTVLAVILFLRQMKKQ